MGRLHGGCRQPRHKMHSEFEESDEFPESSPVFVMHKLQNIHFLKGLWQCQFRRHCRHKTEKSAHTPFLKSLVIVLTALAEDWRLIADNFSCDLKLAACH